MIPKLYQQYFIEKQDERRELFSLLAKQFSVKTGIYPGSFVHITPSFYIPEMAYIDNDRRISKFFRDPEVKKYIEDNKAYAETPKITGIQADYSKTLDLDEDYFDMMFSFYAGFISEACKRYLRSDGILIANNSHGDASLAISDPEYSSIGVIIRNRDKFRMVTENIGGYLEKKDNTPIDTVKVKEKMIGEKFSKYAYAYIFKKL